MMWSKSKLNTMRQCPLKFKFTYLDKLPQPEAHIDLKKGTILHEAFDKYYDNVKGEVGFNIMEETLAQQNLDDTFINRYKDHIINFSMFNMMQYIKHKENFKPFKREEHYTYGNIHGIIDRIDYIDGKYFLIDYKTSKGDNIEDYEDELLFYTYIFQKNTNINIDYIGILFTANQTQPIIKKVDEEYLNIVMDGIFKEIEIYEKIFETPEKMEPKKTFACRWCPYHKECPL